MNQSKTYKAYIAANKYSEAFDYAYGKSEASAKAAVKRKNSPDWKDCHVWVVYVRNGGEERI